MGSENLPKWENPNQIIIPVNKLKMKAFPDAFDKGQNGLLNQTFHKYISKTHYITLNRQPITQSKSLQMTFPPITKCFSSDLSPDMTFLQIKLDYIIHDG